MARANLINMSKIEADENAIASDMVANLNALLQAVNNIDSEQLNSLSVTSAKLANLSILTDKLAANTLSADATGRGKMQDAFVTIAKLNTEVADDATIELDSTDGLRIIPIATPSAGETFYADEVITSYVMSYGSYTSTGTADNTIDTGIDYKHLVIKCSSTSTDSGIEYIENSAGSGYAWNQESGNTYTGISKADTTLITLSGTGNQTNTNLKTYHWFATGKRA